MYPGYVCNQKERDYMNKLISKITDSELEVMRVLWELEKELPISIIRKTLEARTDWEASTIKTLIRRLCKKGVVLATKKEVYYYKYLISEEEYTEYTTQSLIDKLYFGSAKKLVASLANNRKLNEDDIDELRALFKVGDDNVERND
jgi:BlaI family penicillinase repressor